MIQNNPDGFELAFDKYLDGPHYDKYNNVMWEMVRESFIAGWKAAGGAEPMTRKPEPGEDL